MGEPVISMRVIQMDDGPSATRQNRRAHLSPDLLRDAKLAAGEWALLSSAPTGDKRSSVIVQLWPRAGLEDDGMPSRSHGRHTA